MVNECLCTGEIVKISKENILVQVNCDLHKGILSKSIHPIIQESSQGIGSIEHYYSVGKSIEVKVKLDAYGHPHVHFIDGIFRKIKNDIRKDLKNERDTILSSLQPGMILTGKVTKITSYGAFVDLNGVQGLVYITDMSWGRITDPGSLVYLNQELKVVILRIDQEKRRLSLGMKQLTKNPWDSLDPNLKEGDIITGKVVKITNIGLFIEIFPGIEGLLHISNMPYKDYPVDKISAQNLALDNINIGDEFEVVILSIDYDTRKITLGPNQILLEHQINDHLDNTDYTNTNEKTRVNSEFVDGQLSDTFELCFLGVYNHKNQNMKPEEVYVEAADRLLMILEKSFKCIEKLDEKLIIKQLYSNGVWIFKDKKSYLYAYFPKKGIVRITNVIYSKRNITALPNLSQHWFNAGDDFLEADEMEAYIRSNV